MWFMCICGRVTFACLHNKNHIKVLWKFRSNFLHFEQKTEKKTQCARYDTVRLHNDLFRNKCDVIKFKLRSEIRINMLSGKH